MRLTFTPEINSESSEPETVPEDPPARKETRWVHIIGRVIEIEIRSVERLPQRPTSRLECLPGGPNEMRPCPFLSCRHHLAIEVSPAGSLKVVQDWDDGRPTCALDVADERAGRPEGFAMTLDEVGAFFGLTRERVRQIETRALDKLRRIQQFVSDWKPPLQLEREMDSTPGRRFDDVEPL